MDLQRILKGAIRHSALPALIVPLLHSLTKPLAAGALTGTVVDAGLGLIGDVAKNWVADELRDSVSRHRFANDLRAALAFALIDTLRWEADGRGPLQSRLAATFDQRHLEKIFQLWRSRIDAALRCPDDLHGLFPSMSTRDEVVSLADEEQGDVHGCWQNLYDHLLAHGIDNTLRAALLGNPEAFRRSTIDGLCETLPIAFQEQLKRDELRGAWIDFQRSCLLDTRRQLRELRSISAPPLYLPVASKVLPQSLDGLRFNEKLSPELLGREAESAALDAFLAAPGQFLWWAAVGSAGAGKSRLALERLEAWMGAGWDGGFLDGRLGYEWMRQGHHRAWHAVRPTIMVIDYASAASIDLLTFLAQLHQHSDRTTQPVRVLLLDRPGAISPLFSEHVEHSVANRDDLRRAREALYQPSADAQAQAIHLPQREFLQIAALPRSYWRDFIAVTLGRLDHHEPLPAEADPFWNIVERLSQSGRPLLLLMIACVIADGDAASSGPRWSQQTLESLLERMLERERIRHWQHACNVPPLELDAYERMVAFVTLAGGVDLSAPEVRAVLAELAGDDDGIAGHRPRADRLRQMLGVRADQPGGSWLQPLQPDIFGEYLLARSIRPDEYGVPRLDANLMAMRALPLAAKSVSDTLIRLGSDFGADYPVWLQAALDALLTHDRRTHAFGIEGLLRPLPALLRDQLPETFLDGLRRTLLRISQLSEGWCVGVLQGLTENDHLPTSLQGERWFEDTAYDVAKAAVPSTTTLGRSVTLLSSVAAFHALTRNGRQQRLEAFDRWGPVLWAMFDRFPNDADMLTIATHGAYYVMDQYARANRFDDVSRWNRDVCWRSTSMPRYPPHARHLMSCAMRAVEHYSSTGDLDSFEYWAHIAIETSRPFTDDPEIGRDLRQLRITLEAHVFSLFTGLAGVPLRTDSARRTYKE